MKKNCLLRNALFSIFSIFLLPSLCFPATYMVPGGGNNPSLYNGMIAMERNDDIFYWNGSSVQQITDKGSSTSIYSRNPSLYNGTIAYQSNVDGESEIYYWDGSTTDKITDNTVWDTNPSLYNGNIAWMQYTDGNYDIFYWNGSSAQQITDDTVQDLYPSLYNGTIAWQSYADGNYEIYFWDGNLSHRITDSPLSDSMPSLHNGTIAWEGLEDGTRDIFFLDGDGEVRITDDTAHDYNPSVYNGTIAWQSEIDGDYEIYYWDGSTTHKITDNTVSDQQPSLFNGTIAWRRGDSSIYYWDGNEQPLANAGSDQFITVSEALVLDGSGSSDSDGTITSWEWLLEYQGDASKNKTATGETATVTSLESGSYTVTLTVTDTYGDTATDTMSVEISETNILPVANAGAGQFVTVGDSVLLNGSASSDSDGTIISWEWLLEYQGDVSKNKTATGETTTVSNLTAGVYIVTLTVTDNDAATDTGTMLLRVNSRPIASAGDGQLIAVSDTLSLDGSGSSDSDGTIVTWEWLLEYQGDASKNKTATGELSTVSNLIIGFYIVTLTVTDDNSATDTDTMLVEVRETIPNTPPLANAGNDQSITAGDTLTLDGSRSSDSDGTIVRWEWLLEYQGDSNNNKTATGEITTVSDLAVGSYVITLTVTDNDGATGTYIMQLEVGEKISILLFLPAIMNSKK